MTDIITFDVKKPIENSINELVKNLSNDIEKKIREDITNNKRQTPWQMNLS